MSTKLLNYFDCLLVTLFNRILLNKIIKFFIHYVGFINVVKFGNSFFIFFLFSLFLFESKQYFISFILFFFTLSLISLLLKIQLLTPLLTIIIHLILLYLPVLVCYMIILFLQLVYQPLSLFLTLISIQFLKQLFTYFQLKSKNHTYHLYFKSIKPYLKV